MEIFHISIDENVFFGENEFYCYDTTNKRIYFYDLCFKDKKIIVEYNGSHCHPNPSILNTKEKWSKWRCPFSKQTADEKKQLDENKIRVVEQKGFIVLSYFDTDDFDIFCNKIKIYLEK